MEFFLKNKLGCFITKAVPGVFDTPTVVVFMEIFSCDGHSPKRRLVSDGFDFFDVTVLSFGRLPQGNHFGHTIGPWVEKNYSLEQGQSWLKRGWV